MRRSFLSKAVAASIFSLAASAATAQEQTPEMRSYQMRVQSEINANLQCTAIVLTLQDRVKALETELANAKAPKKE